MTKKRQNTYRTSAQTPEEVSEFIDEGVEKSGSFPKFVDALVQEMIDYKKANGGSSAPSEGTAVASGAMLSQDNGAILELVKMTREDIQSFKSEVLSAIESIQASDTRGEVEVTVDNQQSIDGTSVEEIKTMISDFIDSMNAKVPQDVATKSDLTILTNDMHESANQQSIDIIDANIKKIDEVIEYLKSIDFTVVAPSASADDASAMPVEHDAENVAISVFSTDSVRENPSPVIQIDVPKRNRAENVSEDINEHDEVASATEPNVVAEQETVQEEKEISEESFGDADGLAAFTKGLNAILTFDEDETSDEADELDAEEIIAPLFDIDESDDELDALMDEADNNVEEAFVADAVQTEEQEHDAENADDDFDADALLMGFNAVFAK